MFELMKLSYNIPTALKSNVSRLNRPFTRLKTYTSQLTRYTAHHPCIFTVSTVLNSNTRMEAIRQVCLSSIAGHIVIVDWTTAFTKVGQSWCRCGSTVAKLPTDYASISDVPEIIAHSTPLTVVVHLNTSLVDSATPNNTDVSLSRSCMYSPKSSHSQNHDLTAQYT